MAPKVTPPDIRFERQIVIGQERRMSDLSDDGLEWRPIRGYEGFHEVSNTGLVRSLPRHYPVKRNGKTFTQFRKGQMMKLQRTRHGYAEVRLRAESRGEPNRAFLVHRLVLEAFVSPRPPGMQACHYDGDRSNNHVENLRWDTPSANIRDSLRHGTQAQARKTKCAQGHQYDEINTYRHPTKNIRKCRECDRKTKERKRRERAAA